MSDLVFSEGVCLGQLGNIEQHAVTLLRTGRTQLGNCGVCVRAGPARGQPRWLFTPLSCGDDNSRGPQGAWWFGREGDVCAWTQVLGTGLTENRDWDRDEYTKLCRI